MLTIRRARESGSAAKLPVDLERRRDCRIHTVLFVAKVTRAHDAGLWRMRNISDSGMMLLTSLPVAPAERLSISLSDSVKIVGTAQWWDGERCGVAFDAPVDCAGLLAGLVAERKAPRYRAPRLPVSTRAIAFCEKGMHSVRLFDLSQHGAGFAHDGCFTPGMNARLSFADGGEHRGVVRWSEAGRAGMYLVEPIPCARLESAARL